MIIEPEPGQTVIVSVNKKTHRIEYQDDTESGVTVVVSPVEPVRKSEEE